MCPTSKQKSYAIVNSMRVITGSIPNPVNGASVRTIGHISITLATVRNVANT